MPGGVDPSHIAERATKDELAGGVAALASRLTARVGRVGARVAVAQQRACALTVIQSVHQNDQRTMTSRLPVTVAVLSRGERSSLATVLEGVLSCSPAPATVRLIWSGERDAMPVLPASVEVETIEPDLFDHGGTRQLALEGCRTDILALLSDDAEPVRRDWLEAMCRPFRDPFVAAVYGRQIARKDSNAAERVFRRVRYPETSRAIELEEVMFGGEIDLPVSNANAAYRVRLIRGLGGFPRRCTYGEDRVTAAAALSAGWRVVYAADASVWHSHELAWPEMFRRGRYAGALSRSIAATSGGSARRSIWRGGLLAWRMVKSAWGLGGAEAVLGVAAASFARGLGYALGRLQSSGEAGPCATG